MNKQQIDKLHADIQTAVEEMCRERGFKISMHGGQIGQTETVLKYKIVPDASHSPEAAATLANAEQEQFNLYAWKFKYDPAWFGKEFVGPNNTPYRIVGVKPTAEKNCLKIRRMTDNKEFVCAVQFAAQSPQLKQAA